MKKIWLLYDACDLALNRDYVRLMQQHGKALGLQLEPMTTQTIAMGALPDAVLSRQRDARISKRLENLGIPVFNNARVCAICNDKRATQRFLNGLPMPESIFLPADAFDPPAGIHYPVVLKPACSHGGDRVAAIHSDEEYRAHIRTILPEPAILQELVSDAGKDLRIYVLHGQILAGVLRTAKEGIVSNYKKGGNVTFHTLTDEERSLAEQVIRRFDTAKAPLHMAGVDLLYHKGHPVIGEVEDVVGSRMLYRTSDIDIVKLYLQGLQDFI